MEVVDDFVHDLPMVQVSLSDFKPLPEGEKQYPLEYIENNNVIRLKEDDDMVFVGVVDSKNYTLLELFRSMCVFTR